VCKGAVLVGERPQGLATLSGGAKSEQRFQKAVEALWGAPGEWGERPVGKGRVVSGLPLEEALARLGIASDVTGEGVMWSHRQTADADWYFVAATAQQAFKGTLRFRATGNVELWDPVTGKSTPAAAQREGAQTQVALDLPPSGSVFVVFRKTGKPVAPAVAASAVPARQVAITGPWTLSFPAGWGAPESIRVDGLKSWTELDLPAAARSFSGTATYATDFTLDTLSSNACVELELGRVEVIASARVNGAPVGTVWTPPFRLDITKAVKPGVNRLAVDVTSTWHNRLAYDAGQPEAERKTWTISGPAKGSALLPAGLLGPVTVGVK